MPEFVPVEETPKDKPIPKIDDNNDAVERAKQAAEIQEYETERAENKQRQIFAEYNIKSVEDLEARILELMDREEALTKAKTEFEHTKATELSSLQKDKAEYKLIETTITKREAQCTSRESDLQIRQSLIDKRESLLNATEKLKLAETEVYNSIVEQLKRTFPKLISLMRDNANVIINAGFGLGDDLWDETETLEKRFSDEYPKHASKIIEWLKGEIQDCNDTAVTMARSPKVYAEKDFNEIVDNLEDIYELMPILKPEHLPKE